MTNPTPTDWQALCAELVELDHADPGDYADWRQSWNAAIARARAALAQPEPVWTAGICGDGAAIMKDGVMHPIEDVIAALNATALAQPEPQGPTDEELRELRRFHQWPIGEFLLFTISRAVLVRWGNR